MTTQITTTNPPPTASMLDRAWVAAAEDLAITATVRRETLAGILDALPDPSVERDAMRAILDRVDAAAAAHSAWIGGAS